MKKRSIVIVLVLTLLITLAISGTAMARMRALGGYWTGADNAACTVASGQVAISWPEAISLVDGYLVVILDGKTQVVYTTTGSTSYSFTPAASGHYSVSIGAILSGNVVDTLKGGFTWKAP